MKIYFINYLLNWLQEAADSGKGSFFFFPQRIGKDGRGIPGFGRPGLYKPSWLSNVSELIIYGRARIHSQFWIRSATLPQSLKVALSNFFCRRDLSGITGLEVGARSGL